MHRPIKLDADQHIAEDVHCLKCDYNLRGLPADGRCPECATPSPQSMRPDLLRYADPLWVRHLSTGLNWLLRGVMLTVLLVPPTAVVLVALGGHGHGVLLIPLMIFPVGFLICAVLGIWHLTIPEPSVVNSREMMLRRIPLISVVLLVLGLAVTVLVGGRSDWPLVETLACLMLVTAVCLSLRCRDLAARVPNSNLEMFFSLAAYALPFFAGFAARLGLSGFGNNVTQITNLLFGALIFALAVAGVALYRHLRQAANQAAEHALSDATPEHEA